MVAKVGGLSKFNEEVVFALRRGGQSTFPEVTDYANWLRDNYFEPMRVEAQRVGMKQFQDLEADYIIELGPVGGPVGGQLLYQGDLAGLLRVKHSPTAPYLRAKLK